MHLRPLVLGWPSEDDGCAGPTHMHQRPVGNGVSIAQPQEGLLGQVIGAPLARKDFDVSVKSENSVGRA